MFFKSYFSQFQFPSYNVKPKEVKVHYILQKNDKHDIKV